MDNQQKKYRLKKMLYRLRKGYVSPEDCGLPEMSRDEAIQLLKEEIEELEE